MTGPVTPAEKPKPEEKPDDGKPADRVARYDGRVIEYTRREKGHLSDNSLAAGTQGAVTQAGREYFIFTVSTDGNAVNVVANPVIPPEMKSITLNTRDMTAFIDEETHKPAGFYGSARGVMTGRNPDSGEDDKFEIATMAYFADENSRKQPEMNAYYQGQFLYYYNDTPQSAAVNVDYRDKKITGSIHRTDSEHWDIDAGSGNEVGDDGSFNVRLRSNDVKNVQNGVLSGGFYGTQGEFLPGTAKSEDEGQQWSGVAGASQKAALPAEVVQ